MPHEGIRFPLKSEYDRVNFTLAGLRQTSPPSLLELPGLDEAAVRVVPHGDHWIKMGKHWMSIHVFPREAAYTPQLEDGGPDLSILTGSRVTFTSYLDGRTVTITDDWRNVSHDDDSSLWMSKTTLLTSTSSGSDDTSDGPVRDADKADVGDMTSPRPSDGDFTT